MKGELIMQKVLTRFLEYVKFDTTASEESETCPSTSGQMEFAKYLKKEMEDIGLTDVDLDQNGYLMGTLEGNIEKDVPVIGFIAHMDTSPDMTGANVNPKIIEAYDGKDIELSKGYILSPEDSPELKQYVGKKLITTDGTTLLGADDKAGIAEILTAIEYLIAHPEIPHGKIRVGFTPDEEVGRGADLFDVEKFGAKYAYTMDGSEVGELEYENFNAAYAKVTVKGKNVHPGYAKGKMINAVTIAMDLANRLPKDQVPEKTEGYEGFFHLNDFNGSVEEVKLNYIIRDFDKESFEARKKTMASVVEEIKNIYGNNIVELDMKDQYYNMKEMVEPTMFVVDIAKEAMEENQIVPKIKPIRGGTDGARLSFMNLPCPNIFAGGHNFHGRYEYVAVESMELASKVIVSIAKKYTEI